MSIRDNGGPPSEIRLSLEEALDLVGVLEDARDALLSTDHLLEVALVEGQLARINRKVGFPNPEGGEDGG